MDPIAYSKNQTEKVFGAFKAQTKTLKTHNTTQHIHVHPVLVGQKLCVNTIFTSKADVIPSFSPEF